jgi:O-antigen/teichoic acid export membrane protein
LQQNRSGAVEGVSSDDVLGMAGGAGLNLVGAAFSQLALFGIFVILSRWLGTDDIGVYAEAFAFLSLLGVLALSGVQAGVTRFVATDLAAGDRGAVRGTVRAGLALTTASALLLAVLLCVTAPWLVEHAFHDPALLLPLRCAALTLPLATFMDTALAATKGWRTMKAFALIGLLGEPAVRLGLTLVLVAAGQGLAGAMIAVLVSHTCGALLAAVALRRMMGEPSGPPAYHISALFRFSGPSWIASLAATGLIWVDTVLLGILGTSADVGLYNVATRLVTLATFVMVPVVASFGPRIADLSARGDTSTLARSYGLTTSWILRLSLPAFVLLLVYPHELLSLLGGNGFAVGATVTAILAVGKLVDAGTGPCALMLLMTGRPKLVMIDNLVVLVLNIGLNLWLIPRYGIVGSAVAWALSLGVVNLVRVAQVWLTMRMLPFDVGVTKGMAAGAAALAAALAARHAVTGPASLLVGVMILGMVYVGLVTAFGVTPEDRLVLRTLASRAIPRKA